MKIAFYKYQGTGNDFIIINNLDGKTDLSPAVIQKLCTPKFGIGADGLMYLNPSADYDFEMKYFNADGNESTMCGNGGRCLVQFAYDSGMHKNQYRFLAIDGMHEAFIASNNWIHLKMKDVLTVQNILADSVLDTGSPHYVKSVKGLKNYNVVKEGRQIRNQEEFASGGINVNFVEETNGGIFVRTYERGVENETLSCGTGVTASALVFAHNDNGFNRVEVQTQGGHLAVEFDKKTDESFENIWLCGPAEFVFKGEI